MQGSQCRGNGASGAGQGPCILYRGCAITVIAGVPSISRGRRADLASCHRIYIPPPLRHPYSITLPITHNTLFTPSFATLLHRSIARHTCSPSSTTPCIMPPFARADMSSLLERGAEMASRHLNQLQHRSISVSASLNAARRVEKHRMRGIALAIHTADQQLTPSLQC